MARVSKKNESVIEIKRRVGQRVTHKDFRWSGRIQAIDRITGQFTVQWSNETRVTYGMRTPNVEAINWFRNTMTIQF